MSMTRRGFAKAADLADKVYIMDRGEVVHAGPAEDLDRPEVRRHLMV